MKGTYGWRFVFLNWSGITRTPVQACTRSSVALETALGACEDPRNMDPNRQALRALDYSRFSRHLLSTSGDDGFVHIWIQLVPVQRLVVSRLKQHSAPTTGICFSPSSDKIIIVTAGLDKKLYNV
ncbi:hypothetical protein ZIOFF_045504 [Zingiber officinale]|uniref:Uncharacterized protein n=1 Tax=Zingiber officinale TaxID=94328 RepID=A0A8J5G3B2_ZINOF|nr:hypothetical protein ZIOFF_045504 [Zingiber officinale]